MNHVDGGTLPNACGHDWRQKDRHIQARGCGLLQFKAIHTISINATLRCELVAYILSFLFFFLSLFEKLDLLREHYLLPCLSFKNV